RPAVRRRLQTGREGELACSTVAATAARPRRKQRGGRPDMLNESASRCRPHWFGRSRQVVVRSDALPVDLGREMTKDLAPKVARHKDGRSYAVDARGWLFPIMDWGNDTLVAFQKGHVERGGPGVQPPEADLATGNAIR